jgi:hypothetical protein
MNIHDILRNYKFQIAFAFIVTVIIVVLVVVFTGKKNGDSNNNESYKKCICSSNNGTERNCQDTETVEKNYENNLATEFTDLKSRNWSNVSSGEYNYPVSNDCNWKDDSGMKNEWVAWDFTDF